MVAWLVFMAMLLPVMVLVMPCLVLEDEDCCCPEQCRDCQISWFGMTGAGIHDWNLSLIDSVPEYMGMLCSVAYGDDCAEAICLCAPSP